MTWRLAIVLGAMGCGFEARDISVDASDAPADAEVDAAPLAGWWDTKWARRNLITFRVGRLETGLAGFPLNGFPVLIRLTPDVIDYGQIKSDGSDLRFVLGDNATVVPHEIDTFVDDGTTLVWVRFPVIDPRASEPALWLYHGNPAAPAAEDAAGVFAATHVSVHHLGANLADVTGHGHTGMTPGQAPTRTTGGAVGDHRAFDGATQYITLLGESAYDFTQSLAVSAWIDVAVFNRQWQAMVLKGDHTWRMQRHDNTEFLNFGNNSGGTSASDNHNGDANLLVTGWRHVAITYDGAFKRLYVDGVEDLAASYTKTFDLDDTPVSFGFNANAATGGGRFFQGGMDEVRISADVRSPAWLSAEYSTVTDVQLVTVGPDERQ